MRILVVNDDGIHAKGIKTIALRLAQQHDVTVVAPETEKSATAHSITIYRPLRVVKTEPSGMEGIPCYVVDGLPVDCTKIGINHIMENNVDIVISGINHGHNMGSDILYSGTVAAALDAVIMGHHALAVSVGAYYPKNLDAAAEIAFRVIESGLPFEKDGILYNLNVPDLPLDQIKGLKAASQGRTIYEDKMDVRNDPRGRKYIWIAGTLLNDNMLDETDVSLFRRGYASIVPLRYDMTAKDQLDALSCRIGKIKLH